MANLRDVPSHMATLLDPKPPKEHRADQLANAEEHLRRAIIEPYEIALGALTEKFGPTYDGYREEVIPLRESTEGFRTAPTRIDIENRLQEIEELAERGKQAKGRNQWDAEWELGSENSPLQTPLVSGCFGFAARAHPYAFGKQPRYQLLLIRRLQLSITPAVHVVGFVPNIPSEYPLVIPKSTHHAADVRLQPSILLRILQRGCAWALHPTRIVNARCWRALFSKLGRRIPAGIEQHQHRFNFVLVRDRKKRVYSLEETSGVLLPQQIVAVPGSGNPSARIKEPTTCS